MKLINGLISCWVCHYCNVSFDKQINRCPICGSEEVYKYTGRPDSELIKNMHYLNNEEEAHPKEINDESYLFKAHKFITYYTHIHTPLCFISRFMVYHHLWWTFINDMMKGVIPNNRATFGDKYDYITDFMLFAEEEGTMFEAAINNPAILNEENNKITFLDITKASKYTHLMICYYHLLEANSIWLSKMLAKLITINQIVLEVALEYTQKIEPDTSLLLGERIAFVESKVKEIDKSGVYRWV